VSIVHRYTYTICRSAVNRLRLVHTATHIADECRYGSLYTSLQHPVHYRGE
jgi:hypothetical protein